MGLETQDRLARERVLATLTSMSNDAYPSNTRHIAERMVRGKPTTGDLVTVFLALGPLEEEGKVESVVVRHTNPAHIAYRLTRESEPRRRRKRNRKWPIEEVRR